MSHSENLFTQGSIIATNTKNNCMLSYLGRTLLNKSIIITIVCSPSEILFTKQKSSRGK